MSAPASKVDVLAVIDWLIADSAQLRAQPGRGANRIGLSLDAKRARAAVAELVETMAAIVRADEEALARLRDLGIEPGSDIVALTNRARAALDPFGGV